MEENIRIKDKVPVIMAALSPFRIVLIIMEFFFYLWFIKLFYLLKFLESEFFKPYKIGDDINTMKTTFYLNFDLYQAF